MCVHIKERKGSTVGKQEKARMNKSDREGEREREGEVNMREIMYNLERERERKRELNMRESE